MNGQACLEKDAAPDTVRPEPEKTGAFVPSAANYSNETALAGEIRCELPQDAELLSSANLNWNGEHNASQRMFVHNLIVNIARQYADCDAILPDLVKEGKRGFLHAQQKFDARHHVSFSSYANRCINRYIECAYVKRLNSVSFAISEPVLSFDNPDHRR